MSSDQPESNPRDEILFLNTESIKKRRNSSEEKKEALIRELAGALEELICCGVFSGALFEKDKEAHRAWTLGRSALEQAKEHLGVSVINSEFDKGKP